MIGSMSALIPPEADPIQLIQLPEKPKVAVELRRREES
jgi:hypothetical protein